MRKTLRFCRNMISRKVCVVNTHGAMLAELMSSFWSQMSQSYFRMRRP